jgi:hypothetical protein
MNNHTSTIPQPSIPNSPPPFPSSLPHPASKTPNLDQFCICQWNCHNSFDVTLSILNSEINAAALCLQEPWISPHTMTLPFHQNWSILLDHNHSPISYHKKHQACTLINKKYHSESIHPLPDGSCIMTTVELDLNIEKIKTIRIVNLYNPPKNFDGLAKLQDWLQISNNWQIPTFIMMDSNLHHHLWNPPCYPHSHREAKTLIKTCRQMGFKIILQKGVPTFANSRSSQTTID